MTHEAVAEKISYLLDNPIELQVMATAARYAFDQHVNFATEALEIKEWLKKLH